MWRSSGGPVRIVAAMALLLLPATAQDPEKAVSKELQDKINAAIAKGVKYLKSRAAQSPEGKRAWSDKKPLIALALLKSGVAKKDPWLQTVRKEAVGTVVDKFQRVDRFSQMYLAGIVAMLLAEFEEKKSLQELADMVSRSQLASGSWGYTIGKPDDRDNASTAQYALLALQAAANKECAVNPSTLEKAAKFFLGAQDASGGWTYHHPAKEAPHGAVSAIGVASLIICRSNLDKGNALQAKFDGAIQRGIDWLGKNFAADTHPGKKPWERHKDAVWLYYYLYSVERVGMFARTEKFGAHAWYAAGAEFLVKKQRADGAWDETHERHEDDDIATCFALLFLARASDGFIPTGK